MKGLIGTFAAALAFGAWAFGAWASGQSARGGARVGRPGARGLVLRDRAPARFRVGVVRDGHSLAGRR